MRAEPAQVAIVRHAVRDHLVAHKLPAAAVDDLVLIVSELATNAVHASPSASAPVGVRVDVNLQETVVEVRDEGEAELENIPIELPDVHATRGRGLPIVHLLAERVEFARDHGTTIVRACYRAPRAAV